MPSQRVTGLHYPTPDVLTACSLPVHLPGWGCELRAQCYEARGRPQHFLLFARTQPANDICELVLRVGSREFFDTVLKLYLFIIYLFM